MRVTEQIDALRTLSVNPFKYLIAPRLIAAVITLPIGVLIADIIGIMGGFVVSTQSLKFNVVIGIRKNMANKQLEGRIFNREGTNYLVLEGNDWNSGTVKVRRVDTRRTVTEMPLKVVLRAVGDRSRHV